VKDLLALPADRSAHLPEVVALLAQTAMGATVLSDAAMAGAAREASPAAVRPEVSPVVVPLGVLQAAASQAAVVEGAGVVEAADKSWLINPKEDHPILFF